jgi:hypothetical protein
MCKPWKEEARYGFRQGKIERVLQWERPDRHERATSRRRRGDMRKLLDRQR